MKQFDLQEYLKNPDRKIITRDGRSVRIICVNKLDDRYPVVALVRIGDDYEEIGEFAKNGSFCADKYTDYDLFFAQEKKEGWINIYHHQEGNPEANASRTIYDTKEEALSMRFGFNECVDTIKIEWEE